jgi:predicted HTH domain antitoxin
MALQYDRTSPVLDNTNVDNFVDQQGQIDQLGALTFDLPDRDIIRNLNQRIDDSQSYWNDSKGFDLKNARAENTRLHLGKVDEEGLYKHQKQYKENQIFVGEESIVGYVTSQIAGPLVIPAGQEDRHKVFATNLEKAIKCFCEDVVSLERIVELSARNILNKRIAVTHFYYDKTLDDIVMEAVDPEHVILDKNAALGQNPGFICHVLKRSPEQLITEFPDKEEAILKKLGIRRKTPKQMTKELAIRKVWITHYDKDNKPQEGVVWYFDGLVLDKMRNPNYLYAKKDLNLLRYPKKPYIFGNLVNYGTHLIDSTTPLEQAADMQKYLMRRGRQIAENADKANGVVVISTKSGLTKDDGQNLTGDPSQKLFVDDEDGKGVQSLVMQLEAQVLPQYVIADKLDARMQVGNIMGAPTDFTGSQANDGDPTLGEVMIKKNQAAGRQDLMVRAMTRMLSEIYEYLVQMFIVWYTENRHFTYDGGDGEFDFITLKRDLIHAGIRVKASKPANPDRSRIEAIVLKLLEQKAISLLDAYKILQLDNAQQLYDNWAKQSSDPMALARDALDVIDESEAYVAFNDIMAGKPVDEKQNPSKEYILSLRKLMINDDFLKAKKSDQNRFIKYVNKCIDSLETRLALEEASDIGPPTGESLRPGAQLPNPNMPPPQQGAQPGAPMPPQPGGQAAGMPMPPPGQPMQAGPMMPPMSAPTPTSVFAGGPVPAPGQAPMPQPGNPAGLPML